MTVLALLIAAPAAADPAATLLRGEIVSRDGDGLIIRRPGGSTIAMRMNPRTRVFAASQARVRDIKPESYVSVIAGSGPEPRRAERVALYSPSERGFEAGRQPWDTAPGASLTAGWVADLAGSGPRRVTLAYPDGRSAFEIPPDAPVTQIAPGERTLLIPGGAVTAFTHAGPDGVPEAGVIAVGRRGVVPSL